MMFSVMCFNTSQRSVVRINCAAPQREETLISSQGKESNTRGSGQTPMSWLLQPCGFSSVKMLACSLSGDVCFI